MDLLRIDEHTNFNGPHQGQNIIHAGADLSAAKAVMIMIHGRGASAQSILGLAGEFENVDEITFLAPQAANHTWYPYSFLAPTDQNQPGLNSGLQAIYDVVSGVESKGFSTDKIFLLGFSQGACLASEFAARHPAKYAGVIALSGGLIGNSVDPSQYNGDMKGTPVFLGCSDIDPHIPEERVQDSAKVFNRLGASVQKNIYPGMGHLVNEDEIKHIQELINLKA